MVNEFTEMDFFRDQRLVENPYPYYEALRQQCPVTREDHYGVTMVTGWDEAVRGAERCRDVLVVHLGDRPVSRLSGAARR